MSRLRDRSLAATTALCVIISKCRTRNRSQGTIFVALFAPVPRISSGRLRWFFQDAKTFKPYNQEESEVLEAIYRYFELRESVGVAREPDARRSFRTGGTECDVKGGVYVVEIPNRVQKEKHTSRTTVVVRATYFWQDTNKVRYENAESSPFVC